MGLGKAGAGSKEVVPIPATKQSESILSKLSEAHRTHTETELVLDVLLVGPSSEDLQVRDWARTQLEGSLEDKLWRLGMLVERGYTSTSHNPRQPSRSQGIIHTSLTTRHSALPTIVCTGGEAGSHVANMCNAVVVLGAVRWRSPGVVTVNIPAPASCMKSFSGYGQNSGRVLSVSQKS